MPDDDGTWQGERGPEARGRGQLLSPRLGTNLVRGHSPRGKRLLELSRKLKRGDLTDAEYVRLRNEALKLSGQ